MPKIQGIEVVSHTGEAISGVKLATAQALVTIGLKLEKYAKALCPVGTPESTGIKGYRGGTLRNSITYEVQDDTVTVGSNVESAPYVELGTGPNFTPPPDWEQFESKPGSGIGHSYVHPRPFLRPAVEDHLEEYKYIWEDKLKNV